MNPGPTTITSVCAVIVAYHPDLAFPQRVEHIARHAGHVVVVDNRSSPDAVTMLRRLAESPRVSLVENSANLGVATALNQGMNWAKRHGYEWILLFDQDTTPFYSFAEEMLRIAATVANRIDNFIIGPNYVDTNTKRLGYRNASGFSHAWTEVRSLQTSGTLLSMAAFDRVGPFCDKLFIDGVDVEYCLRARSIGYKIIRISKPLMLHTYGLKRRHRFLWRVVWPTNHAPARRYFVTRNLVYTLRRHGIREPGWAVSSVLRLAKLMILIVFFENRRASSFSFMARGIWDGLRSKYRELEHLTDAH